MLKLKTSMVGLFKIQILTFSEIQDIRDSRAGAENQWVSKEFSFKILWDSDTFRNLGIRDSRAGAVNQWFSKGFSFKND